MIVELFAVCCNLWTIISASGAKAAIQKPGCGTTVCVQRKSLCVHFDVRKSASNVLLYMKDLQMCAYCPASRHVAYFKTHRQWLKLNVDFHGKSVRWSQTPSPLAYAVYAFINVDNCERPLTKFTKMGDDSVSRRQPPRQGKTLF